MGVYKRELKEGFVRRLQFSIERFLGDGQIEKKKKRYQTLMHKKSENINIFSSVFGVCASLIFHGINIV